MENIHNMNNEFNKHNNIEESNKITNLFQYKEFLNQKLKENPCSLFYQKKIKDLEEYLYHLNFLPEKNQEVAFENFLKQIIGRDFPNTKTNILIDKITKEEFLKSIITKTNIACLKTNGSKNTAFYLCLHYKKYESFCKLLLEHGADINAENERKITALGLAICNKNITKFKWLIEHGADIIYTYLHDAVACRAINIVNFLLKYDKYTFDVNEQTDNGWTPLHCASRKTNIKIVEMLINNNANVNSKNIFGQTPLHLAIKHNNLPFAYFLLQHSADINNTDNNGWTPLHYAVDSTWFSPNVDLINLLLKNNAKVNINNQKNDTPLDFAKKYWNQKIIHLLEQFM